MISLTCKQNKYILLWSLITQKYFFYAKGPQLSILGVWWVPVAQNQCLQRPLFLQLVACNKCNRLHVPISSAIAQLRSTKMFSLCAATGCTKYFHLSLRLFVQNFLCARYKCTHAVSSCRQSTHFLFCRGFTQSELVGCLVFGSRVFTQQDKWTASFLSWIILQTFLVKVEDIFLTFDQGQDVIVKNI